MSVSPSLLVISLAIGVPLMLLAIGVLYHAWVLGQQPASEAAAEDELEAHVEALATASSEELLASMQRMMQQMQGQLTSQRASLERLLSEPARSPATAASPPGLRPAGTSAAVAAGEFAAHATGVPGVPGAPGDLRMQVRQLATEGLSDRAIARQLGIGLEEVRIARMRGLRS